MDRLTFILLTVVLAFACAGAAQTPASPPQGRTFYADGNALPGGDGRSPQSAWNSTDQLNAQSYLPGDTILLRRGTKFHGRLMLKGSGSQDAPIRLSAYGEGKRPKIVAGSSVEEALRLFNQQYWDIDSLDLAGGNTYGIFISGDNGILHHIHLANLLVHDVTGGPVKHKESGLVAISPGSAEQHFDDVVVDGVTAWNTNQWVGILVGGGNLGYPPESDWSTNAVIRNSTVHDVQGDGIVLFRVHRGRIENSVAWNTGMQVTESMGTPNAIWTWMCDDCTVAENEAYLTDSPGVDGGAYDIDYGNTRNSVIDNYGHDTQGYCIAVFGAGFVTSQSLVRGNLCINNGRSPRMAKYQGAIFLLTWNNGSIDGLTIENNTVEWSPPENSPALLNNAAIKPGTAIFRNNTIASISPWMLDSNTSLSLAQNHYSYFGVGAVEWRYGSQRFSGVADLPDRDSSFTQRPLQQWESWDTVRVGGWQLSCDLPVFLNPAGLIGDAALRQIVLLKSLARQYEGNGLRISLRMTSPNADLFGSAAFQQALADLDLIGIDVSHAFKGGDEHTILRAPDGKVAREWSGLSGPVVLGLAVRNALGQPAYAQMRQEADE